MRGLTHWLRRISLVGVVVLPSFMATCGSGMSSLQINALYAPATELSAPCVSEVSTV